LVRAATPSTARGSAAMPCTAMNAADSGPPKPALALLAMRAMPKSVALIQRRAFQRSHSQFAEPMWSGCMWVTMTRSTGSPSRPVANTSSQAARVAALSMPQSTMLQPSRAGPPPSPASRSRSSQRLMWLSANGSCIRTQRTPGATSTARPGSGTAVPRQ
jgi:hypothetical protein